MHEFCYTVIASEGQILRFGVAAKAAEYDQGMPAEIALVL
jgi:hypothetical protein